MPGMFLCVFFSILFFCFIILKTQKWFLRVLELPTVHGSPVLQAKQT